MLPNEFAKLKNLQIVARHCPGEVKNNYQLGHKVSDIKRQDDLCIKEGEGKCTEITSSATSLANYRQYLNTKRTIILVRARHIRHPRWKNSTFKSSPAPRS